MSAVLYSDALGAARPSDSKKPQVRSISRGWTALLIVGDLLMFLVASLAATQFVQAHWNAGVNVEHVEIATAIYASMWLAIFWRLGLYLRSFALSVRDEFYFTFAALCIGAAPLFILFSIVPSISTSRVTLLLSMVFSIGTVGVFRSTAHRVHDYTSRAGRRLVVVGSPERIDDVVEELCHSGNFRVYWLAVRDLDNAFRNQPVRCAEHAHRLDWFRQALIWRADRILFTECPPPDAMPHLLAAAGQHGMSLAIAPPRIRAHAYSVSIDTAGNQVLIVPQQLRACRPAARLFKRMFDLVLGCVALLLLAPAMLAVTLLLLTFDRSGPILYRQVRLGRNGKPFNILKFRTMRVDAEANGAQFAVKGDPRVTKLGRLLRRTSLDELPQIFNVLRNDMSIVGPRPERPVFVEEFRRKFKHYDERHLVKPGITGWSQVNMRRVLQSDDVAEKLKHDLFYVENWSPFLDLSVITKTALEFLFHRAA
ncbi:MAG TPA: sugar transferase [Candidatus Acidoferrales bacterium]|nr:sugar transferase [Candidatus Acidoferrales bacterium]